VGQFSATKVANLSFRRRRHAKKTQEAILLLRKPLLLLPLAITTFEKLCALPFLVHWAIKTFCVPSLKKSVFFTACCSMAPPHVSIHQKSGSFVE
jgi:hypothetical protein